MIPKIIHYCWFGPKPFPKLVSKCIETWTQHLGDYEFNLWNESNSPMNIPFVQEAYAAKKYAFVSDYVRFWALFQHGGIYLDTDMFVIKDFNNLLNNDIFFGWETLEMKNISCGIIGSTRNQVFFDHVCKYYNEINYNKSDIAELVVPKILTKVYQQIEDKNKIAIYPYDYFYPFPYEEKENVKNFIKFKTKNTYAIHLWNISWGSRKAIIRDWIFYHLKKVKSSYSNNRLIE